MKHWRRTVAETTRLIEVSQGRAPADLYFANGRVLNVFSGEVITASVAVAGERIAYVGGSDRMVGPSTQVIDADGQYLLPGFIEPHTHLDVSYNPTTLSMEMLKRGTTALFSSHCPFQDALGVPDFRAAVQEVFEHPARVFIGVEAETGFYLGDGPMTYEEMATRAFDLEGVLGLCEVSFWPQVVRGDREALERLDLVRRLGKTLEGHTVGANYDQLNAAVAAGFTSCHEPINVPQVLDRLRLGLSVMLRHNDIRPDMPELVKLLTEARVNSSRLMWTADGMSVQTLVGKGHLDHLITYAVELGADPITAVQMSTINPATYFGLDDEMGAIAPGRQADILLVKDLRVPTPEVVFSRGRVAARKRELVIDYPTPDYYGRMRNIFTDASSRIHEYTPEMFLIPAQSEMEFPVIQISSSVLTKRLDVLLQARDGYLRCDPERQVLHYSLINPKTGAIGSGFVTGLGYCLEGMAFTNILSGKLGAWGTRPEEMARAANRARELGGGIVIVEGGCIVFEMPLPLAGSMSLLPLPDLADQMAEFFRYMHDHGFPFEEPFYTLRFADFTGVPQIHLTTRGVIETRSGAVLVPPMVPEPS